MILLLSSSLYATPSPSIWNGESYVPVTYEQSEAKPVPPVSQSWKDPNTEIFIGISHYRDSRCADTLKNLFSKAKFPDRLKIGEMKPVSVRNVIIFKFLLFMQVLHNKYTQRKMNSIV